MKLILNILLLCSLLVMNTKGICQTINEGTNPTATRARCSYGFDSGTGNTFSQWHLPASDNAVPVRVDSNAPDYNLMRKTLPVVWKNVEASAYPDSSVLQVQYTDNLGITRYVSKSCGPFSLTFKTVTFAGGSSKNIPCYSTEPVTIALNNYVNTENNGYDQGKWITRHFEWTLPSGWQTTSFQAGTFVGPSSITVIPPASTATAIISVKAKANTQKSATATLQITRNLENFSITGPSTVTCYSTNRYSVPAVATGVTYSWQLPLGWTGVEGQNYIDVTATGNSGTITCTATGCNQPKPSAKAVAVNIIEPGTTISGLSSFCSSGTQYTVQNLPGGATVSWSMYPCHNLSINPTTGYVSLLTDGFGGSGTITAIVHTNCGDITLPAKTVLAGTIPPDQITGFEYEGKEFADEFIYQFSVSSGYTDYAWSVGGGTIISGQGTNQIEVLTPKVTARPVYFDVAIRVKNLYCGWSVYFIRNGLVVQGDGSISIVSPNPSDGETTISIEPAGSEAAKAETTAWDMEIYTQSQLLKERKTRQIGRSTTINTSGWPEGLYIVKIVYNGDILTGKLMVKH